MKKNIENFELPNEFQYEYFYNHRYEMPKSTPIINGYEYEIMCNNGYTKLYRYPFGKLYWLLQNEASHKTPDWKFHVSVVDEDLAKAWKIVAQVFISCQCKSGMKVKYLKENVLTVKGREITIYIPIFQDQYSHSSIIEDHPIDKVSIEQDEEFWFDLFMKVEYELSKNNIRSNGLANGDLGLGNYVSLRNEAYCYDKVTGIDIYPPDQNGWNALKHKVPFKLLRFQTKGKESSGVSLKKLVLISVTSLIVLLLSYKYLYNLN